MCVPAHRSPGSALHRVATLETSRELAELAGHYPSRSAAIQDAIHSAWRQLQADKLEAGYAAAVADNPHYPYESAEEAAVLRTRRRARQQRDTLT